MSIVMCKILQDLEQYGIVSFLTFGLHCNHRLGDSICIRFDAV